MKKKYFSRFKKKIFEPYNIPQIDFPAGVIVAVNRQIYPLILDIIKSAKVSLDIAIFQANISGVKKWGIPYTLYSYIWNLKKRDVKVRILLNKLFGSAIQSILNHQTKKTLESLGVDVKYIEGGKILHTKLIIVDDKIAFIGSTNLTISALSENWEIGVKIEGKQISEVVLPYFKKMWAISQG